MRLPAPIRSLSVVLLVAAAGTALQAADRPAVSTGRPHRVLIGDDSKHILAIVDAKGDIEWSTPIRTIHDAWLLPGGNLLFQTDWQTIVEMTPDKREVWRYDAGSNGNAGRPVEVHAFQRLPSGRTMIAESGPGRIIEVDSDGKLQKEIPLKLEHHATHTDTRLVRKLDNGHYLVAHEGENKIVREYDDEGQVVWEFEPHSKVYSAIRLAGGNTLIGCGDGHRVIEVDPAGKTVWSVGEKELPGITLAWVTMVERLPGGNTVIVNCHAGPENPQIIEVTPERQVAWTFKDFERFGNSMPVARVLDAAR
ncbi:MAG TPA: PQQ-binding-like beta-propeller repeat protein [Pirellulales bacterium]|jgi:outer membrane protein assembly factor BamB|nr:PQQ-binding-like beta-propeller repeat protein [Pirellulales bacterium]